MVVTAASIAHAASTGLPPFWNIIAPAVAASGLPVIATQWRPCKAGFWVRWPARTPGAIAMRRAATRRRRGTAIGAPSEIGRDNLARVIHPRERPHRETPHAFHLGRHREEAKAGIRKRAQVCHMLHDRDPGAKQRGVGGAGSVLVVVD